MQLGFVCAFGVESLVHIAAFYGAYLISLCNIFEMVLVVADTTVIIQDTNAFLKQRFIPISRFI